MRIIVLILTNCLFFTWPVTAQRASEVGPFFGVSYYVGDINPGKHFYMSKPALGLVHRYILNPHFALKNSFYYGSVQGDDAKSKNPVQLNRNLHFKSSILDMATEMEFNFFPFDVQKSDQSISNNEKYYFTPYIFIGISLFSFNPKANYNGTWFDLQPLGTEGQGTTAYPEKKNYALTQLSIPFGGGFKYDVSKKVNIAVEWGVRKTLTDYIDDVSTTYPNPVAVSIEKGPVAKKLSDQSIHSENTGNNTGRQRGDSKSNDLYSFAGLMITYKISSKYQEQKCYEFK